MPQHFLLPDLAEGLSEGEILQWFVQPGEEVELNQPLVEVETAKAAVQIPSPFTGTVTELLGHTGDVIPVGAPIVAYDSENSEESKALDSEEPRSVLVGYGPAKAAPTHQMPASTPPQKALSRPLAKPPVRKLARDLGVNLSDVKPTGPSGSVTRDDVQQAAGAHASATAESRGERIPVRGVRRETADAMTRSAAIPQASCSLTLNMGPTLTLVDAARNSDAWGELRITPFTVVVSAALASLTRTPLLNATWDDGAGEIILHNDVDLGVAVATQRGLLVPVIRRADALTHAELANALTELAHTAREGTTLPANLVGATFTLTNVGVFGVDAGTPLLPPDQSAILALGQIAPRPWVDSTGELGVAHTCTLTLSFDHRVCDGEHAARFLAAVGEYLSDPGVGAWISK